MATSLRRTRFAKGTLQKTGGQSAVSGKFQGKDSLRLTYTSKKRKKRQKRAQFSDAEKKRKVAMRLQQDPVWACETIFGATTLWQKQKEILDSICKNRRTAVRSCHGAGKALALDTPLPTPYGWTTMEEIKVGDALLDEQGKRCRVEAISEIQQRDCYEIEFDDGTIIVTSDNHLWNVLDFRTRNKIRMRRRSKGEEPVSDWRDFWEHSKTLRTSELAEEVYLPWDQLQWSVPCSKPLEGVSMAEFGEMPVPPYTLGAWLGDGHTNDAVITASFEDGETILESIREEGIEWRVRPCSVKEGKNHASYRLLNLRDRLRSMNLLGRKHVPEKVLRAPLHIRLAVLQGIMDTDGWAERNNSASISISDPTLALGIVELIGTFGWKVRWKEKETGYVDKFGIYHQCKNALRITFRPDKEVFRLRRKLQNRDVDAQQMSRHTIRTITDIRPVESVPTKCVVVDSPSRLFLASRSFVPTHNSYTAARAVAWFLLTHPDSIVATTAPTDRQVKKILWQEIRRCKAQMKLATNSVPLIKEWTIRDGWFAMGLSTDDPDAFQGLHAASGHVLIVIDEASGVPKPIWDAIDGSLSSEEARLLSIGNPTNPVGSFHDEFTHPHTHKIAISAFDTPNFTTFGITEEDIRKNRWKKKIGDAKLPCPYLVTPLWVREKWETWGESSPMYKSRVKGEFPEEAEDTLIPLTWVEQARQRYDQWEEEEDQHKKDLVPLLPVELGVDVARYGRNETVVSLRRGAVVKVYKYWYGKSTMETVGRVVQIRKETGATSVKIDDGGVGGGVVDRLKELGEPVEPVNSGSKPKDTEHFLNLRAEMWWNGREMLRKGEVLLGPDETAEGQLSAPKYTFDSKGRIKVESKEDMEDRGVLSPDRADSLLLALLPSRRRRGEICW